MQAVDLRSISRYLVRRRAWNEGRKAFHIYRHEGKQLNPHAEDSDLYRAWNEGFEKEASFGTTGGEG